MKFKIILSFHFFSLLIPALSVFAQAVDPVARANRLYFLVTAKPLLSHNPLYAELVDDVRGGREKDAVTIMMKDPNFIQYTVRTWGTRYLTAEKSSRMPLDDSLAMLLGTVRDDHDFREFLTGNFIYGAQDRLGLDPPSPNSSDLYDRLDLMTQPLTTNLKRIEPQWGQASFKEAAGVMTTRAWAQRQYQAGTNRRGILGSFETFLCMPMTAVKTPFLPTDWIHRDVPRDPSGDPRIFQQECRSCHAPMDAMVGAFAFLDFTGGGIQYLSSVAPKFNQLPTVYADGHITTDDSWVNYLTLRDQLDFGWRGNTSGRGVHEYGAMIAAAKGFTRCFAMRSLKYFCGKELTLHDPEIDQLSTAFEQDDQYHVQEFFTRLVTSDDCK